MIFHSLTGNHYLPSYSGLNFFQILIGFNRVLKRTTRKIRLTILLVVRAIIDLEVISSFFFCLK